MRLFFLLILGSLFTTFWPIFGPFGCLFGVSWEQLPASWVLLGSLWIKNTKKLKVFKVFENATFWLFELLMALLGSSCPLFGRSWSQNEPQKIPQICSKKNLIVCRFFDFFSNWIEQHKKKSKSEHNMDSFFAQNPKQIYKRNQDEPKRAIMSFKEQTTAFKKP